MAIGSLPRWAKALLFIAGVLVLLFAAVVALYLRGPDPTDTKLGGAWELRQLNSWIIDSGRIPRFLQRVHGRTRTNVAEQPYPYRYLGDDCVVYAAWEHGDVVYAACGDRPPIRVGRVPAATTPQLDSDPIRLNGTSFSWADLKQHAQRGENF